MSFSPETALEIVIRAVDDATGTLEKVSGELGGMQAEAANLGTAFSSAGKQLTSLGQAALPMSLAAGAALGLSAKAAIDFQQNMELLHTQAGLSQQAVDGLKDKVLALGPAVGQGPSQLAEAFYHIASAGNGIWSTAQMLDMLKVAAQGAAIGQANLDDTTYSLTSALASNIKGAKDAAEMMSTLNAIVGAGDMRFQDLNGAISTGFLSTAATFGVSLQSMGAALATLTDNGEHADAAATRLRMTMALMAAPTSKAADILNSLGLQGPEVKAATEAMTEALAKAGVTTLKLSADMRQSNGIMVALKDLKDHLEASGVSADAADAILSRAFGGGRTDAALLTMLQNLDRMDEKFKLINKGTGNFAEDWAAQQQTAAQHMKEFQASVETLGVKLGDTFLPFLTKAASALSNLADWFSHLNPHIQQFIVIALAIATALAPVLMILGALASALGVLIPIIVAVAAALAPFIVVIGLVIGAVTLLAVAWTRNWFNIQGVTKSVIDWFSQVLIKDLVIAFNQVGSWLEWLKGHWLEAVGFIIGYVATLPIRIPILMSEAIIAAAMFVINYNWDAVFAGIYRGAVAAFNAVKNAGVDAWNYLSRLNWGAILSAIGRGIGNAIVDLINGAIRGAFSGIPVLKDHIPQIPHLAVGTSNFQGGLALVGEEGPELVNLPKGSQVFTHKQTKQLAGSTKTIHIENFNSYSQADLSGFASEFAWRLR